MPRIDPEQHGWDLFSCVEPFERDECEGCLVTTVVHAFHFAIDARLDMLLCWECFERSIGHAVLPPWITRHIHEHYETEARKQSKGSVPRRTAQAAVPEVEVGRDVDDAALERAWVDERLAAKLRAFNKEEK